MISAPDPFLLKEFVPSGPAYNAGNQNDDGKTRVALNPAANNGILVVFGDSQGANVVTTPYTPSNANVLNFNIYNGATYAAADPVLGCSNAAPPLGKGNCMTRLADLVQGTGKFTNTILVPAAIGGTQASQWASDTFNRIAVTFARLASRGVTASAVLIQLGANDCAGGTTGAAYTTSQQGMIDQIRKYYAGPIFIGIETWFAGVGSAPIQSAQSTVVNAGLGIIAGANTDSIISTGRQSDNTHWNDTGAGQAASLWLAKLQAYGAPFA